MNTENGVNNPRCILIYTKPIEHVCFLRIQTFMPLDDFQPARVKTCSTAAWGFLVARTDLQLMNIFWVTQTMVTCSIKVNITPYTKFRVSNPTEALAQVFACGCVRWRPMTA